MTKRDLFRLIFKLFGLYSLVGVLIYFFNFLFTYLNYPESEIFVIPIVLLLITIGLVYCLLFKPDVLIQLFKLEKGFDDEHIKVSVENFNLLTQLSILIIGLLLLFFNLPDLLIQLVFLFKSEMNANPNSLDVLINAIEPFKTDVYALSKSIIASIFGYLLMTNYKWLSIKIEQINRKN
jgi:hypothetical protein